MGKAKQYLPFLIAIAIGFIFSYSNIIHQWQKVSGFILPDSDDIMRTLRVREWLAGQGFYDNLEHRANPPIGGPIHWSRLSDLPLALFELILNPIFGPILGEKIAIFILPPILGAILILIIGKIAVKLGGNYLSYFIAAAFVTFSASANLSFVFGRVDHHNLQLIALATIIYGIIRNDKKGGIFSGIALGASITIGFEMLPLEIVAIGLFCLFWVFDETRKEQIISFTISLAISILIGFVIDVAPQNYFKEANDFLSIAQLVPILSVCLALFLAIKFTNPQNAKMRFIILVLVAIIGALIAWQFKELHKPVYWQVSPLLRKLWFDKFAEVMPLYNLPITSQLSVLMPALLALLCAIVSFNKADKSQKPSWILLITLLIISSLMAYFWQNRVHPHVSLIAIIILSATLPVLISHKNLSLIIMVIFVIAPLASSAKPKNTSQGNMEFGELKGCDSAQDFSHISNLPKGLILNNIDVGMKALIQTKHDIITTPFHRDLGRETAYDIFLSKPNEAKAKIGTHHINYVTLCMYHLEIPAFAQYAPDSLIAHLANGDVPQYLREIKKPTASQVRAFEFIETKTN